MTETGLLNIERYRGLPVEKSIMQVVDNLGYASCLLLRCFTYGKRKQFKEYVDDKINSVERVLNLGHMARLLMGKKRPKGIMKRQMLTVSNLIRNADREPDSLTV